MYQQTILIKVHILALALLFSLASYLPLPAGTRAQQDIDLSSAIFKSTDSGATWSVINPGLPCVTVGSIMVNPTNPSTLYAGTDRGVFKSTDAGEHWITPNGIITLGSFTPAISPDTSPAIYAAGGSIAGGAYGVMKSTDTGSTWTSVNRGLQHLYFRGLAIDPVNPSTLYVMSQTALYRSTDGASHWDTLLPFQTGDVGYIQDFQIDPHNPSTLYCLNGLMLKSTDSGITWKDRGPAYYPISLSIDPRDSSILYVITNLSALYRSTDGGDSWSKILEGVFGGRVVIDPANSSTLYVGTREGIIKSVDGGSNWFKTDFPVTNSSNIAFDPTMPSTIYASTGFGKRPTDTPWIYALYITGKQLSVRGEYFDAGAKILLNGEEQKTQNSEGEPTSVLIGKKAGKKVKRDPGTQIQVRNADGKLSQEVIFFFPDE